MVVVNQNGEVALVNAQAEKQFGYRRDALTGQKVTNMSILNAVSYGVIYADVVSVTVTYWIRR